MPTVQQVITAMFRAEPHYGICRLVVDLLALAHDRGCEAELAAQLEEDLRQKQRPDIAALRALFAPSCDTLPRVEVQLADLSAYDQLLGNAPITEEAAA